MVRQSCRTQHLHTCSTYLHMSELYLGTVLDTESVCAEAVDAVMWLLQALHTHVLSRSVSMYSCTYLACMMCGTGIASHVTVIAKVTTAANHVLLKAHAGVHGTECSHISHGFTQPELCRLVGASAMRPSCQGIARTAATDVAAHLLHQSAPALMLPPTISTPAHSRWAHYSRLANV